MPRQDDREPVHLAGDGFRVWARSVRGKVRPENQDAWCALTPKGVRWGPPPSSREREEAAPGSLPGEGVVVGVFDGLGGHPNGRAAARAAALTLPRVLASDGSRSGVLATLDEAVRVTRGATTAVVAFVSGSGGKGRLRVVSVGDSAAYQLDGSALSRVNPLDRSSRHELTDCLGAGEGGGHEQTSSLGAGVVLVSDGVDGSVALQEGWGSLLQGDLDGVDWIMDDLFLAVEDAGAPDNATLVVVRPVGDSE